MRALVLLALSVHWAAAYKAAYVEHHATSPCGSGSCGAATRRQNLLAYQFYIQAAAAANASIIVFPEYGLTGESSYSAQSWLAGGYTESFPDAGPVPCDAGWTQAASLVALSCAARAHGVVVVANLAEWDAKGQALYNTDVALDSDGRLLAKYRKMNLWGESYMSVPGDCPIGKFSTRFGVTFGMFTCADLIYNFPANRLVEDGVTEFLVPAAWSDQMAQMQVMGFAQGWSLAHSVNLVLCNHRMADQSGSGAWIAGQPQSFSFFPANADGRLKVADMSRPTPAPGRRLSGLNGTAHAHQLLGLDRAGWRFGPLGGGRVCSGTVCCSARASGPVDGYVLAALDGLDQDDGEQWHAQVCAVLACAGVGRQCLRYQRPAGALRSVALVATGMSNVSLCVPEVIVETADQEQLMLAPGRAVNGFNWTSASSTGHTLLTDTEHTLVSSVIYGRRFKLDQLPYHCPAPKPSGVLRPFNKST